MDYIDYNDAVLGPCLISEPVVVELMQGPSLQRLRGVDQSGYPEPFFPHLQKRTRFEHSVGVFLLLRQYGACLKEQVAGLIHDVSHTAFSHCVDYSLGDSESERTQSHQDSVFESFVRGSEIPGILARHGLDVDACMDDSHFPLKERPLPNLCADRIDYSLRSAGALGESQHSMAILETLRSDGREWYFDTIASARQYAALFSRLNATFWCGVSSAMMFRTVGDCLCYARQKGYLATSDFFATDEEVLDKVRHHLDEDDHLCLLFDRMNHRVAIYEDPSNYESVVFCKSRVVDPLCMHEGKLSPLSDVDPSWRARLERESIPKTYFLKFGHEFVQM